MSNTISKSALLKQLDKDAQRTIHDAVKFYLIDLSCEIEDGRFDTDGWISVKDRMPEPSHVLVIDKNYNQTVAEYAHGRFWPDNLNISTIEVTHWMPLPEPPKGEDNE